MMWGAAGTARQGLRQPHSASDGEAAGSHGSAFRALGFWARASLRGFRARQVAALAVAGILLVGCSPSSPGTGSGSSGSGQTSAASSASAAPLTQPGRARDAVRALMGVAGSRDAVKVDITPTEASLSIVRDGKPMTWAWNNGVVSEAASDIANVQQATFDPDLFNIDDVGQLFDQAAKQSHSSSSQELQIVEYNQGQVLMTVTTNPESSTVFFRPDGSLVSTVNFGSTDGITEALKDCVGNATQVVAVGYQPASGLYVQVAGQKSGTVDQTTRPAALPPWTTTLKGTQTPTFNPVLVNPGVIATILGNLRSPSGSASPAASGSSSRAVQTPTGSPSHSPAASRTTPARPSASRVGLPTPSGSGSTSASAGWSSASSVAPSASGTPSSASASASGPVQPDISWVIDRRDTFASQPVMRFSVNGQTRDYLLDGTDVTALYGGQ